VKDFMAFAGLHRPEQYRDVTRVHVIAWRDAVLHNPVLGVKGPSSMNREGVTPALGDYQARMLLEAPLADKHGHAILGHRHLLIVASGY
jgi:integrase/recombinase XerD